MIWLLLPSQSFTRQKEFISARKPGSLGIKGGKSMEGIHCTFTNLSKSPFSSTNQSMSTVQLSLNNLFVNFYIVISSRSLQGLSPHYLQLEKGILLLLPFYDFHNLLYFTICLTLLCTASSINQYEIFC